MCDPPTKLLNPRVPGFAVTATMISNGIWGAGKVVRAGRCSSLGASTRHGGTTLAQANAV